MQWLRPFLESVLVTLLFGVISGVLLLFACPNNPVELPIFSLSKLLAVEDHLPVRTETASEPRPQAPKLSRNTNATPGVLSKRDTPKAMGLGHSEVKPGHNDEPGVGPIETGTPAIEPVEIVFINKTGARLRIIVSANDTKIANLEPGAQQTIVLGAQQLRMNYLAHTLLGERVEWKGEIEIGGAQKRVAKELTLAYPYFALSVINSTNSPITALEMNDRYYEISLPLSSRSDAGVYANFGSDCRVMFYQQDKIISDAACHIELGDGYRFAEIALR